MPLPIADHIKDLVIPPLRAYVRYAPLRTGKQMLWDTIIAPRFAWHPHTFTARTKFGARISGQTDEIIEQYLYYFGVWEPEITDVVSTRLRPGDGFIDVGANVGYYSLLASALVGQHGTVVALEPAPVSFTALARNLKLNRARNVRALNVAASDRPGQISLIHGPSTNRGLTRISPAVPTAELVDAQPLSALVEPEEFARVRLVKIDVEGAESEVIDGMLPLLEWARPDLEMIVELHRPSNDDLLRVLDDAGFRPVRLENDYSAAAYLGPRSLATLEPLTGPIDFECNALFVRERPSP
jgi:FkbM family methyltransferase